MRLQDLTIVLLAVIAASLIGVVVQIDDLQQTIRLTDVACNN